MLIRSLDRMFLCGPRMFARSLGNLSAPRVSRCPTPDRGSQSWTSAVSEPIPYKNRFRYTNDIFYISSLERHAVLARLPVLEEGLVRVIPLVEVAAAGGAAVHVRVHGGVVAGVHPLAVLERVDSCITLENNKEYFQGVDACLAIKEELSWAVILTPTYFVSQD